MYRHAFIFRRGCGPAMLVAALLCLCCSASPQNTNADGDADAEFSDNDPVTSDRDEDIPDQPDTDKDADADPDPYLSDAATDRVTRIFSHYMDANDPKLQPGETRVTAGSTGYGSPFANYDVNDEWVVYCTWDYRIVACRLESGACFAYDVLGTDCDCAFPSLVGDTLYARLAWPMEDPENPELRMLQMNLLTLQCDYTQPGNKYMDSFGNHVVWAKEDGLPSDNGLFVYDIQKDEISVVPGTNSPHSRWPRTSENYLIWNQSADSDASDNLYIKIYNYANGQITNLSTKMNVMKWMPSVGERYAAWSEYGIDDPEPGYLQIWDIQEKKFVSSPVYDGRKHAPQVWEDKIVFTDYRKIAEGSEHVSTDIFLRDISKEIEVPLCYDDAEQGYARIYERWVLWPDTRWPRNDEAPYDIDDIVLFDLCSLELYKDEDWCR